MNFEFTMTGEGPVQHLVRRPETQKSTATKTRPRLSHGLDFNKSITSVTRCIDSHLEKIVRCNFSIRNAGHPNIYVRAVAFLTVNDCTAE